MKKILGVFVICFLLLSGVALAKQEKARVNAEMHRSTVAGFVGTLLDVADQDKGIGEEVRVIAQEQNQSMEAIAEKIEKIENRGAIRTFLIGTDYKNVGALRSEMVHTRNRIEQLNRLRERTENEASEQALQEQIQNMEQEQTRIEEFLQENENKFSLFGWFVKLFIK